HLLRSTENTSHFGKLANQLRCLFHTEPQHIGKGMPFEFYLQGRPIKAFASADFTGDIDIRQEVHLNGFITIAGTGFTASPSYIKGKTTRLVTSHLRFR